MHTNAAVLSTKTFICIAALSACAAISARVQAEGHEVIIKIPVSYADLDLGQAVGAQKLYRRLRQAAWIARADGNRVGLQPLAEPEVCRQKAIGDAVRAIKQPRLTAIYLETHTLEDAKTLGIDIPVLAAAK
jgi:UrcA family protein